jgi:hypothetical protein
MSNCISSEIQQHYLPLSTLINNLKSELMSATVGDMEHVIELMDSQISLAISEIMEYINDKFNSDLVKSLNNIGGEVILTTDNS